MINFFRKIRHQSFTGNKISKYLLYALGEIFLVVIGILIALQVNNSNTQRKNEEIKQVYLKSLIVELNTSLDLYNYFRGVNENRIAGYDFIFETINDKNAHPDSIQKALTETYQLIGIVELVPTAFQELLNSDNFQLFDKELRDEILTYYNGLQRFVNTINVVLDDVREFRLKWYQSIDLAYMKGFKTWEGSSLINWQKNPDSPQFIKATNFIATRKMANEDILREFDEQVDAVEALIIVLEKYLK